MKSFLIAVSLVLFTAPAIAQDVAVVVNHPDGNYCIVSGHGLNGTYMGPYTLVKNNRVCDDPSSWDCLGDYGSAQCNAVLVAGIAEERLLRLKDVHVNTIEWDILCDIVVTPSGNANVVNCELQGGF